MPSVAQHTLFVPPELYPAIIAHVDNPSTLYSLLLVSHATNWATEPALYHSVSLRGLNLAKDLAFLVTVAASERRARHVRRLYVKLPHLVFHQRNNGYVRRLDAALLKLVNITVLACDAHYVPPVECTFQLTEFRGALMLRDRGLDYGPFLARQLRIELLEICWEPSAPPSPTLCPNLVTLSGPTSTLLALLPGRSIRHLQWREVSTHDVGPTPMETEDVAEPLRHIRSFSMKALPFNEPPFVAFASFLEDLRYLELDGDWVDHIEAVSGLPQLRGLTLCPCPTEEQIEVLFAVVDSLHFIEGYDRGMSSFVRWDRESRELQSVLESHDWASDFD